MQPARAITLRDQLLHFAELCLEDARLVTCTGCGSRELPEAIDDVTGLDPCGVWTVVCPDCARKVHADIEANESKEWE